MADLLMYRGYRIIHNTITDTFWVEKDGVRICWATSYSDAKRKIDTILD